ncbi:MAG: hypothetical protein HY775_06190 [Acidobacteria bacterium]|nr:hypothetical protein [Acidobacteriota bacterium]
MRRARQTTPAAIALLVAVVPALAVPAAPRASAARASATRAPRCTRFAAVWSLGPACKVAGGYDVLLRNGAVVHTHGPDVFPDRYFDPYKLPPPRKPACVTNTASEFHAYVIYARPFDVPDHSLRMLPRIRDMVSAANGIVYTAASRLARSVDLRVRCSEGKVAVEMAMLPTGRDQATFSTIVSDLSAREYNDPHAKYWVWYDDYNPSRFAAGTGTITPDDRLAVNNPSNRGPDWAVTFGVDSISGAASVMLHELGHNMGAVQASSPHASGFGASNGGHCNDGQDIMCYADKGPTSHYRPDVCYGRPRFDCNYDDYFNPRATPSTYLGSHWNLASPLNRFVQGCMYRTGTVARGLGGHAVDGVSSVVVSVPSSCRGRRYSLSGVVVAPAAADSTKFLASQTAADAQRLLPDFDVRWYSRSKLIRTDSGVGPQEGTVPFAATRAQIVLVAGVQGTYILNAI